MDFDNKASLSLKVFADSKFGTHWKRSQINYDGTVCNELVVNVSKLNKTNDVGALRLIV